MSFHGRDFATVLARVGFWSLLLLGLLLPLSAQARLSIGVVPGSGLFAGESQAQQFAAALQAGLGEEVQVRLFADEVTLNDWLSRFRQVELAVFSRGYLDRRPSGEFILVAEYLRGKAPRRSNDLIVARYGSDGGRIRTIQNLLLAMDSAPDGKRLLGELGIQRFTLPGMPVPEEPPPIAEAKEEVPAAKKAPAKKPEKKAEKKTAAAKVPTKVKEVQVKAAAPAPPPAPVAEPEPPAPEPPAAVAPPEELEPALDAAVSPVAAGAEAVGAGLVLLVGVVFLALLGAAGYMIWQLRRLNTVMGELVDRSEPEGRE